MQFGGWTDMNEVHVLPAANSVTLTLLRYHPVLSRSSTQGRQPKMKRMKLREFGEQVPMVMEYR